jgi:hypothetical protein
VYAERRTPPSPPPGLTTIQKLRWEERRTEAFIRSYATATRLGTWYLSLMSVRGESIDPEILADWGWAPVNYAYGYAKQITQDNSGDAAWREDALDVP